MQTGAVGPIMDQSSQERGRDTLLKPPAKNTDSREESSGACVPRGTDHPTDGAWLAGGLSVGTLLGSPTSPIRNGGLQCYSHLATQKALEGEAGPLQA